MSKAFVKDDADDGQDLDAALGEMNPLPEGVVNYTTAAGLERLQAEMLELKARLAGTELDEAERLILRRRERFCEWGLQGAQVAGPTFAPDRVRFGTRVHAEDENGEQKTYDIVGVFEADPKVGRISWLSPLAKAFMGHAKGEVILAKLPGGELEFEITRVEKL